MLTPHSVNLRNLTTGQDNKLGWPSSPCPAPGMKGDKKIRKQKREEARAGQAALQESSLVTCRARQPLLLRLDEVLWASPHSSLQQEAPGTGKREPECVSSADEPGSRCGSLTPLLFNEACSPRISTDTASGEVAGTCCLRQGQRNPSRRVSQTF